MNRQMVSMMAVLALLPMALQGAVQHPNLERGFSADTAFQIGDIDHVNLFNGNLAITIPIGNEYPAGGDFSYGLTLVYSSKLWDWEVWCDDSPPSPETVPCRQEPTAGLDFNAGLGWMVSLGKLHAPSTPPRNDSGDWLYVGPDGAEHRFHKDFNFGDPVVANVFYTRDNSYLRLKTFGSTRVIEFPDGSKHVFDGAGELIEMRDAFENSVHVSRSGNVWTLSDAFRSHKIHFANWMMDGQSRPMVDKVVLAAFGNETATYSFDYEMTSFERPCPFDANAGPPNTAPPAQVTVPLLRSVTLPDSNGNYWLPPSPPNAANNAYYLSGDPQSEACRKNGALRKLVLPTQGEISWDYTPYLFPPGNNSGGNAQMAPFLSFLSLSPGVSRRTIRGIGSAGGGTWQYTPKAVDTANAGQAANGVRPVEIVREVVNPQGDKTTHYFAGHIAANPGNGTSTLRWEYGLPYSPTRPQGSGTKLGYLSSTQHDGSGATVLRSRRVRYARDWSQPLDELDSNRRMPFERTDYENGSYADVLHSDFDGLGHYRKTTTGGNFGAGDVRTTTVNYNPGASGTPGVNSRWLLNLYDSTKQEEGGDVEYQSYCFDPDTGFLRRNRIHKDGTEPKTGDVIVWQTKTTRGHVKHERYLLASGGQNGALCNVPLGSFDYRMDHTYASGSRATSRYHTGSAAMPFFSLNQTIDPNTGLPNVSRDVSGLSTNLKYDLLGRIEHIRSSTGVWTEYTYTAATNANSLAKVHVAHRATNAVSGTPLAQSAYHFDAYGRLWQERELMPDGTWSKAETRYNAMGWKTRVSERQSVSANGSAQRFTIFGNFDPFGRPRQVTAPDGYSVTLSYDGIKGVHRTTQVRTSGNDSTIGLSNAKTTETYDRQGRLWKVDEPLGGLEAVYEYDVGNRLTFASLKGDGVNQIRRFAYDGRGFLLAEWHPEKGEPGVSGGWVSYNNHDARGHAREKLDGAVTLALSYDAAERLTLVRVPGSGGYALKSFQYAGNNSGGDRRLGRLWKATRYNRAEAPWAPGSVGTIAVTETYEYRGPDGRVSKRFTDVGPDSRFTQAWAYDDIGNVTELTYPRCLNGGCVSSGGGPFRAQQYGYTNGRMTQVSGFVNFMGYHANGMIAHVSHANGTTYRTELASDAMARPSNIKLQLPGIGELALGTHKYDGTGNLIVRGPEYFLYDQVSRITRHHRGDNTNQRYTYDTFGNMGSITTFDGTNSQTRTYVMNRQKNRVASTPYDLRGNMTQWATQSYRYDELNNLQQKNFPWETYIYTADDERVLTMRYNDQVAAGIPNLNEIYTLRDLDGKVLRRYLAEGGSSGTWSWSSDYLYDGRGWALVEIGPRAFPNRNKHYAHDHLGTPIVITGQDGSIVGTDSLWAYGEPVNPTESYQLQRFTGHERDYSPDGRTFDLDYMHARHCVPYMGRFMSVDPAKRSQNPKMPQSWNRYSYGLSNPMRYVDPDGEAAVLAVGVAALGGGVVDSGLTVVGNLLGGRPALQGAGGSFVRGAAFGATGFGLAKVGAKGIRLTQTFFRGRSRVATLATRFAGDANRARLLKKVIRRDGSIRTTDTVARQLAGEIAGKDRSFIPTQAILATIGKGVRSPDPQGTSGFLQFAAQAIVKGSRGVLEVVVDSKSGRVAHVLFKRIKE